MTMHHLGQLLFMFLVLTNIGCARHGDLQNRNECIVEVLYKKPEAINEDILMNLFPRSKQRRIPLSGYVNKADRIYLQFDNSCQQRKELTEKLLKEELEERILVINSIEVVPGPETIDIRGDSWRKP